MVIIVFGRELEILYVVSQLFALVALIFSLYAFQLRRKVQLLNFNTISALCAILHYFFLGAWSGAAIKAVSAVRDATAAYETHKHRISKLLPLFFVAIYIATGILAFDSPFAILPVTASVIYTITIYIADISKIRLVAILTSAIWLTYDICVFSIVGIASEAIFIFDDLIAIYRYRKRKTSKSKHRKSKSSKHRNKR